MRQLFPAPLEDVDPDDAYADDERSRADRPWVLVNFVSSLDGAIAVEGRSAPLGGPADQRVFRSIRAVADVILVGAGTARAENYGPPQLNDTLRASRLARGQAERPRIAVCTESMQLDYGSRLFSDPACRPFVVTHAGVDAEARARAADKAELLVAGDGQVDLVSALAQLGAMGSRIVLCEGGPRLAGTLAKSNLVDELCLTMSGLLVGGTSPRLLNGPALDPPLPMGLARILEDDGLLFFRYVRSN